MDPICLALCADVAGIFGALSREHVAAERQAEAEANVIIAVHAPQYPEGLHGNRVNSVD